MYADDLQILICIREVNNYLSKVFEKSLANYFNLNPSKSMVLPIYRNHLLPVIAIVSMSHSILIC
jgi:hypothetical protein